MSRSTKEGEDAHSFTKPRASPSDVCPASESCVEKNTSMDTKLSDTDSNFGAWESDLVTWSQSAYIVQDQVSETRMAKAQAWEILALEAQARIALQSKPSITELPVVMTVKQESSQLVNRMNTEDSKNFPPRPFWSSKTEYILAIMGYLMMPSGLLCFVSYWVHKGNCSFFIAYILMLLGIGIPLLFLEMAIGQRAQQGSVNLWKNLSPWFGGVGYSMVMVCFIRNTYLNVYNSWILFYMSHIFYFVVPWDQCPLQRNSSNFDPECEQATSYTYFWYRQTLKASDRIEDGGQPSFSLGIFLFLAWCLICAFMVNGIKSIGKVLCVLMLVPYFIIICFLIRTLTMSDTEYGLKHLLIVKVASISDLTMWCQAGIRVLFDIGLGFGPIVSFSSHTPDFNNCLADAFFMALFKIITLLITTPFLLSILGFWATTTTHRCCKKNKEKLIMLITQGILPPEVQPPDLKGNPTSSYNFWLNSLPPPLRSAVLSMVPECNFQKQFLKIEDTPRFLFLIFTEAMSLIPGSGFWTVLFFLLLLGLGLCANLMFMLGIILTLQDTFPFCRRQPRLFTVCVSMTMFLCGLIFTQPSGIYYFSLLSEYWVAVPIISIIICETLAVAWAYGAKRFLADMTALLNSSIFPGCDWLWRYVSPVVLLGLLTSILVQLVKGPLVYMAWDSSTSKEVSRVFPKWSLILIAGLSVFVLMPIPAYFAYCLTLGIPFRSTSSSKLPQDTVTGQLQTTKEASKDILQGYKTKS
ncbi:orphan sodium- and chloride-dependent neurotransmitter transporter NTT5 isoform X2 [Mastomys coucha]|uniref:orphan sodium- and chloride-dependent neurotransmitter transporter NTT5 isoform X2 n=1 Tax=Mastomys coucha TaxID=35658 RepID=UPI0012615780|nr:orphan sodium- and chloride-dependent neurotransmitter transporter NTT5 isoform X2 [Mastomys coucha]